MIRSWRQPRWSSLACAVVLAIVLVGALSAPASAHPRVVISGFIGAPVYPRPYYVPPPYSCPPYPRYAPLYAPYPYAPYPYVELGVAVPGGWVGGQWTWGHDRWRRRHKVWVPRHRR